MKKKTWFMIVVCSLLLCMSVTAVSLYDNIYKTNIKDTKHEIVIRYEIDFKLLMVALAQQVDSTYQPLSFSNDLDVETREEISKSFQYTLENIRYEYEQDGDFVYQITQTQTNQQLASHLDRLHDEDQIDDYMFYHHILFDEQGEMKNEGDLTNYMTSATFSDDIIQRIPNCDRYGLCGYNNAEETESLRSQIQINLPTNIELIYVIPAEFQSYQHVASVVSFDHYIEYLIPIMVVFVFILALLILLYPFEAQKEVWVFRSVIKGKGEMMILLLGALIIGGIQVCLFSGGATIGGYAAYLLSLYHIQKADGVLMIANGMIWFLTLLAFTQGLLYIKYMVAGGLIRFIKEDTWCGQSVRWLKRELSLIEGIQLDRQDHRWLIKHCIFQLIVLLLFAYMPNNLLKLLLIVLYIFLLFALTKKQMNQIRQDYHSLIDAAHHLALGNFEQKIDEHVGVFSAMKDELNQIKIGFEKAVKEEMKSQNMKTELISNVSHDLKTPLTCIKNYLVLLQDEKLDEQNRQEYLENLVHYTNRLQMLIEDLFEVSKVTSGDVSLELAELDLIALIGQIQAEHEEDFELKKLHIVHQFKQEKAMCLLDGEKTYRIFENLFSNISKYAMPSSRVYIHVEEIEKIVQVEIKNISEMEMNFTPDEIIERFVRGDKSRHEKGSGLGLAIAQSFTELQNGQFKIEIDGDLFKVILCFHASEHQEDEENQEENEA